MTNSDMIFAIKNVPTEEIQQEISSVMIKKFHLDNQLRDLLKELNMREYSVGTIPTTT